MTPSVLASNPVTTQPVPCSRLAWLRPLLLGVALVLVVVIGVSTVYRAGPYSFHGKTWGSKVHRCDFTVFVAAGQAVLDGADIYEAHNRRGWYYIYPPAFAIVMTPFAVMPLFWASLIWYVISVTLIVWAVRMCVSLVRNALSYAGDAFWLYTLPPVLVIWLLISALEHGQTTPLLFWLVMAALMCQWRGHEIRGAVCLAGAILLKVFPMLLLGYFAWRKRWRFVGATVVAVALGVFVLPAAVYGWQGNLTYLSKWFARVAVPATRSESDRANAALFDTLLNPAMVNNQSLQAVLWRLTGSAKARGIAALILAVMAGVIARSGWRSEAGNETHVLSAVVIWMLVVPPVSWSHYFMLLLLPLTALVAVATAREAKPARQVARVALVVFAILALTLAGSRTAQSYGPLCWGTLALWAALMVCVRAGRTSSIQRE